MLEFACPSWRATDITGIPFAIRTLAQVWRRSCQRGLGRPSAPVETRVPQDIVEVAEQVALAERVTGAGGEDVALRPGETGTELRLLPVLEHRDDASVRPLCRGTHQGTMTATGNLATSPASFFEAQGRARKSQRFHSIRSVTPD
jgi:hypothetical protein